ncbi:origin recognition complex subunit 3 isoform X2 [Prorops nasuta]|uniref:origin recognition complex subunit 3 isoform X2 n=1 Tax=Prorops nasuta TaxID=863751 RepID=UPI0034CD95D4
MDNVSVSKGIFVYNGNYKIGQRRSTKFEPDYVNEPWYITYKEIWNLVMEKAEKIRSSMFRELVTDLCNFVEASKIQYPNECINEISTAILLMGINVPDHTSLFREIIDSLKNITPYIALIWSVHASNLKNLMDETIHQIIGCTKDEEMLGLKRTHYNFRKLQAWYQKNCSKDTPLIIILPDFESLPASVLHDFILVLSSYAPTMKFVLVFGIATVLQVVHRSLTYDVTSKLRVFQTPKQDKSLSELIENIIFSSKIPFKLIGSAFQLLTDIFLFYDFSVDNFLKNYKFCIMRHFYGNNLSSLCCPRKKLFERIQALSMEDITEFRNLPSVNKHMITNNGVDKWLNFSEKKRKNYIWELLKQFYEYVHQFMIILRCLHALTATLPNAPLGKKLREIYRIAATSDLASTQEYKESIQLLKFLSKQELIEKLNTLVKITDRSNDEDIESINEVISEHIRIIKDASLEVVETTETTWMKMKSRSEMTMKLKEMSQKHLRSPYKDALKNAIDYLDKRVFSVYICNLRNYAGHEIFCFYDAKIVKSHLSGSLKGALHTALNDPQHYLECRCCKLDNNDDLLPTMPDINIVYKLHLESGKLINMYDWLQAFNTVISRKNEAAAANEDDHVGLDVQARFTRAVAELQFLGFIKASQKKVDHVRKLT